MKRLFLLMTVNALVFPALAQSFNVDISADSQSAPADSFGAAAGQKGFWNNVLNADESGEMTLKKLDGSASSVKLKFPGLGATASQGNLSGDFGKLVGDYHYTNGDQALVYEVNGLARGVYIVYAYSNRAGDNGASTSDLSIAGKHTEITGTIQANQFAKRVTHAVGLVELNTGGALTLSAAKISQVGVLSGFQIVKVPVGARVYVDADAAGKNDGSSWADAFTNLFAATHAAAFEGKSSEIWVVAGTHRATPDNTIDGDRADSFVMANDVRMIGGFAGTETSIDQREIAANETVLSGWLHEWDEWYNTHHIVRCSGVNSQAALDGFTLKGGRADEDSQSTGAGLWIENASPAVRNCVFADHSSHGSGGAVSVEGDSQPSFNHCTFYENDTYGYGGALSLDGFAGSGKIIRIWNCRFGGNYAEQSGGAVDAYKLPVWVFNCVFSGNMSGNNGGAIRCGGDGSDSYVANCAFYANSAHVTGGLEAGWEAAVEVRNSIFFANRDANGESGQDREQLSTYSGGQLTPRFNLVDGWTGDLGGEENFAADPGWLDADGPDGLAGTPDDDLRLGSGSACIDRGRDSLVFADWFDEDADGVTSGEKAPLDLLGNPRFVDDSHTENYIDGATIVDLGAFEYSGLLRGDMNCDDSVDFDDIDPFVLAVTGRDGYQAEYPDCNWLNGDVNLDGTVDFDDIDPFVTCITNGGCE